MMQIRYGYIHGFNSSWNSETFFNLKALLGESLFPIHYSDKDCDFSEKIIEEQILKESKDSSVILIGSSLGGFWAKYFANKLGLKALLINPSFNPSISLLKYLEGNKEKEITNFVTGKVEVLTELQCKKYIKYEKLKKIGGQIVILSGTEDTVISSDVRKQYSNYKLVELQGMGHRLEKKFIPEVLFELKNLENTYAG